MAGGIVPAIRNRQSLLPIGLLVVCILAGCDGPKLAPVEGRVMFDGQPLAKATIVFMPDGGGPSSAAAQTDADGRFRLKTVEREGVQPGRYKVLVSKSEEAPIAENKMMMPPKELLPPIYRDMTQTPLRADVPEGGAKDLEFALSGKP